MCFWWRRGGKSIHKIILEELLQLSLSGRIGEVSNVQSPALSGTGNDGLVLGGIDRLVTTSADAGALGGTGGLVEGSIGHLGSRRFNGHVVEVWWIDDTKCTCCL